jgi:hypothetical protein
MKLKEALQHFQDEVAQRNLQILFEVAIEKETLGVKEIITPLKKPVITKRKKSVVPNEDPPSTRMSVRLSVKE